MQLCLKNVEVSGTLHPDEGCHASIPCCNNLARFNGHFNKSFRGFSEVVLGSFELLFEHNAEVLRVSL